MTLIYSIFLLNYHLGFIEIYANINFLYSEGWYGIFIGGDMHLHEVVREGCLDSVLALLNEGVDVNIQDDDGDTALHIAAAEDRLDIVQALLNAGADVSIKNFKSVTSLCIAAKNGNLKMVI